MGTTYAILTQTRLAAGLCGAALQRTSRTSAATRPEPPASAPRGGPSLSSFSHLSRENFVIAFRRHYGLTAVKYYRGPQAAAAASISALVFDERGV